MSIAKVRFKKYLDAVRQNWDFPSDSFLRKEILIRTLTEFFDLRCFWIVRAPFLCVMDDWPDQLNPAD